jgi:hypothetical protein
MAASAGRQLAKSPLAVGKDGSLTGVLGIHVDWQEQAHRAHRGPTPFTRHRIEAGSRQP